MNERVLVIEDEAIVRALVVEVLADAGFDVVSVDRADDGLEILRRENVALVVSDIVMPGLSGLELLHAAREIHPSLPVVLVTGAGTYSNLTQALAEGANGIVVKPFSHADLVNAVNGALSRARAAESELRDRIVTPAVAAALANAIEARDLEMHGHCERLADLASRIAAKVGLSETEIETVRLGAVLHDIGKIAIPDRVLLKAGALTAEERALVQSHPLIGDRLLEPLELLTDVRSAIRHHHERWDGDGYPDGLAGDDVPRAARIVAVADAVEAMSARRPYRDPLRRTAIVRELIAGRGTQWDPAVVDVVLDMIRSGELAFEADRLRVSEASDDARAGGIFTVLLVEDDPVHATLVADVIRRAVDDVRVIHAADVASAEKLFTDCSWSLAVLDHNLPDGSGLDLLERLRRRDPGVPVLMMTGEGSERLAVEAFRRGATDYVVKSPDSARELQTRVRALLAA